MAYEPRTGPVRGRAAVDAASARLSAQRQHIVSGKGHRGRVPDENPDDHTALLLRVVGGDPAATAEVIDLAASSTSPALLVAAGLLTHDLNFVLRAGAVAASTRDRQLVALAETHLAGDLQLLDVLVRDHLTDHPDNILAAWIAGGAHPQ
jgi:hypothetical protein